MARSIDVEDSEGYVLAAECRSAGGNPVVVEGPTRPPSQLTAVKVVSMCVPKRRSYCVANPRPWNLPPS